MPDPISAFTSFSSVILNILIYLVVGSLIWLGLHPPRSTAYLSTVGIMYLMFVSLAALCEWLLA